MSILNNLGNRYLMQLAAFTAISATAPAYATEFAIDQFFVGLNGNTLFFDSFGDGNPPPSATNYLFPAANSTATYATIGTITESNGRARMNAATSGQVGQNVFETNSLVTRAILTTPTDPSAARNLGPTDTFRVSGVYDLVMPGHVTEDYRIRLTDRSTQGDSSRDSIDLRVQRLANNQVAIQFVRADYQANQLTVIAQRTLDLTGNPDQIRLDLAKVSSASNDITATFSYLKNGAVLSTTTFAQKTPIFNDTSYTRGAFAAQVLQGAVAPSLAATLTTGSPTSLSQTISTGSSPFNLSFDYQFETTTGSLIVTINGVTIGSLSAPGTLSGLMQHISFSVSDLLLLNLTDAVLTFTLDGPTGSKLLLDNIAGLSIANGDFQVGNLTGWTVSHSGAGGAGVAELATTPIPAALPLFATGAAGLGFLRWRRNKKKPS